MAEDPGVNKSELPVDSVLPELVSALRSHGSAVLVAPTGAGKTTRVPPAILDSGLAEIPQGKQTRPGTLILLEPRRLAARAAAARMAFERGRGRVGDEVGYRVRFDSAVSKATRIEVMTGGVFLRRLQSDPFLEGVGAVIFDEFHERSLDTDVAFAMVQRLRAERDQELPVVVMSATLDVEPLAAALGGGNAGARSSCPIIRSEGRAYPVEVRYLPASLGARPVDELVLLGVRNVLGETDGDVLVFLPGVGEIRRAGTALTELSEQQGFDLLELYGDLPLERQASVLQAGARRRVILATNVAETSVTIPGVTAVVDTGTARRAHHDLAAGLDRLQLVPISRASAKQRAGRAGRTGPGLCARLWTEAEQANRPEQDSPELQRVDLTSAVLQLLVWGERAPAALPWLDAPPPAALERSMQLLDALGATREGVPTAYGHQLARLPVHPRLAGLLVQGAASGLLRRASMAAALLSERDPFAARRGQAVDRSESDLLDRVQRLERSEKSERSRDAGRARAVLRVAKQLERLGKSILSQAPAADESPGPVSPGRNASDDEAFLRLLVAAMPDRVARRRAAGEARGIMVGGRGVRLAQESAVRDASLFLCVELSAGAAGARSEALVRLASRVELDWLPQDEQRQETGLVFDEQSERIVGRHRLLYRDLVIEESSSSLPGAGLVSSALQEAASSRLERALSLQAEDLLSLQARLEFLREARPQDPWPRLEDETWRSMLPRLCAGRRSFAELRRLSLAQEVMNTLDHRQRASLADEAPEFLVVPSGSRKKLRYEQGRPPVLAVRIQEVFGWTETPRLAGGRVPVVLQLLAPNNRPQQVTDDLASFWAGAYAQVRKDLRARYPKHAWPEDPTQAVAERRPKRRR